MDVSSAARQSLLVLAAACGCQAPGAASVPTIDVADPSPPPASAATSPARAPPMRTSAAGRIALDDKRVFWIDAHESRASGKTDAPCRLLAAPIAGGAEVELATLPTASSAGLAMDDAFVYVAHFGKDVPNPRACPPRVLCSERPTIHGPTGEVLAVPKSGGPPRVLVAGARDPAWVATDGKDVFWADGAEIFRVGREGGSPARILAGETCRSLAVDETHVYCLGEGIVRVPKAGGTLERLARKDAYEHALALDATHVYFDGILERRRTEPLLGASPCRGSQSASCVDPDPWIDRIPALTALPKVGGPARTLAEGVSGTYVVLDARRAYWVSSGRIFRVELAGGPPVLAAELGGDWPAEGLAVNDTELFWVAASGKLGRAWNTRRQPGAL